MSALRAVASGVALAFALSGAACTRSGPPSPGASEDPSRPLPSPLPSVVARVNGQAVSLRDLVPLAKPLLDKAADREKARPAALRAALDQYVRRELLFQEAERRGLAPDDKSVDEAYNLVRLRHPDDTDWKENLLKQGLEPEAFRRELRIQLTLARLGQAEASTARPATDEEAEAHYQAHQGDYRFDKLTVRHLLFAVQPPYTPQQMGAQRARAEAALFRLRRGEKLEALARELSEDATTKDKGGLLAPLSRGDSPPEIEAALFALQPGEISEVLESPAGVHIFELVSRTPGGLPPFESLAPVIKERIDRERRAETVKKLEERLLGQARIENYL